VAEIGEFRIDINDAGLRLFPLYLINQLIEDITLPGPPLTGQYLDNR
jgi:hypothetical protein